jgi:hypothetical protein
LGYFPYIDRNLPTNYVSPFKPHGTMWSHIQRSFW